MADHTDRESLTYKVACAQGNELSWLVTEERILELELATPEEV